MKGISGRFINVEIRDRIKQILFVAGAILFGLIISFASAAQDFHKAKKQHFREKYKTQLSVGDRACHILNKKRNVKHRSPLFASRHRKPKPTALAEVDGIIAKN